MSNKNIDVKKLIIDILVAFYKHIVLYVFLISVVGGIVYLAAERNYIPLYRSSVTFMVRPSLSATADNASSNYAVIRQIARSFPYIIMNDGMKDIIQDNVGETIVKSDIHVESLADTNSFTVSVTNIDKEKSAAILMTIINNYSVIGEKIIGDTYINMISEITTSDYPINKNVSKQYALISMGIVTAILFVIFGFYGYQKKSITGKKDFKEKFNMPCLVSVPKVKGYYQKHILISDSKIPYLLKEQIKKLRIKLEGWSRETGAKVFLITSSLADEGKSTISVNLALSLVEKHYKVLLMDFDFRNPSVLAMLGYDKSKSEFGLYDLYEHENVELKEIVFTDKNTDLDILTSGNLRGHSVKSLINVKNLDNIMKELRSQYDFIILDTPPSSVLSDSSDIACLADYGIYVVRCDYAPASIIEDGLDILSDSGLKFMGCVLNYSADKHGGYYKYYKRKARLN